MKTEKVTEGIGAVSSKLRGPERTPTPAAAGPDRLQKLVEEFCEQLRAKYARRVEGHAKGFKGRVLAMIAKRLPPFRKSPGRPRLRYVTLAVNAYQIQIEEIKDGRRERIDWRRIALDRDPTFAGIRSDYKRRAVLKRLRDAVHARLSMTSKNQRATA